MMRNSKDFKEMTIYRKEDTIEFRCKMETGTADKQTEKGRPLRQTGTD